MRAGQIPGAHQEFAGDLAPVNRKVFLNSFTHSSFDSG